MSFSCAIEMFVGCHSGPDVRAIDGALGNLFVSFPIISKIARSC